MSKNENERIKFLSVLEKDTNEVTVAEVSDLFRGVVANLDKSTQTFKNVKEKLGEDQYIRMMTSLINSFLSTLYVNAGKDREEQIERLDRVNKINEDLITYTEVVEKNG